LKWNVHHLVLITNWDFTLSKFVLVPEMGIQHQVALLVAASREWGYLGELLKRPGTDGGYGAIEGGEEEEEEDEDEEEEEEEGEGKEEKEEGEEEEEGGGDEEEE
jgi:hypothetical protein